MLNQITAKVRLNFIKMKKRISEGIRSSIDSPRSVITLAAFIFLAIVVVRSAWLNDDAYFSARTLDNWGNGYGLTWNVDERVQAYTHPLWLFLIAAPFFISHSFYFSNKANTFFFLQLSKV